MENVREATSVTGTNGSVKNKTQYFNRGCGAKQKTLKNIFIRCFAALPLHRFIFFSVRECLARWFARGLNNLCAAHRFSVGMPKDAKPCVGFVRGRAVGLLQRVIFLYHCLQLFKPALFVFFSARYFPVAREHLNYSQVMALLQ